MLGFHVRIELSSHMTLLRDEDFKSSDTGIDTAIDTALRQVPHLLSSVMEGNKSKIDTITLTISFARPHTAATIYKLMDKAEKHALGLFELLEDDDDEQIEILPDRE